MRLVHRDKGCAVCLAAGVQDLEALYLYCQDSDRFEGCHIIDLVYQDLVSCICNSSVPLTYFAILL